MRMSPASFRFTITERLLKLCSFYNLKCIVFFNYDSVKVLFKLDNIDYNTMKIIMATKRGIEDNKYICNEKYTVQIENGFVISNMKGNMNEEEYEERMSYITNV